MSPRLLDQLNELADHFTLGAPGSMEGCRVIDFNSGPPLTLPQEARQKYIDSLHKLMSSLSNANDTVSRETIEEELFARIYKKKTSGTIFSAQDAASFADAILGVPVKQFRVIRQLHGAELPPNSAPVCLGGFSIDSGERLLASVARHSHLSQSLKPDDYKRLYIQCIVSARENGKAREIADSLFYRFELIFRVLIGRRTDRVHVGILTYSELQLNDAFLLSEEDRPAGRASSLNGPIQPFIFNDSRFPQAVGPFLRLFELIQSQSTEIEKHVLRCAEWIGQAIAERNEASAFVKAATALEALFSGREKGPITPSIMAQISESCAFVLGTDAASSIEIERQVKRLYAVRSSVVHSGTDSVDETDLNSLIDLARRAAIVLILEPEFNDLKTMDDLSSYFKQRRYGSK